MSNERPALKASLLPAWLLASKSKLAEVESAHVSLAADLVKLRCKLNEFTRQLDEHKRQAYEAARAKMKNITSKSLQRLNTFIEDVPQEVIGMVLQFLGVHDALQWGCCDKRSKQALSIDLVWEPMAVNRWYATDRERSVLNGWRNVCFARETALQMVIQMCEAVLAKTSGRGLSSAQKSQTANLRDGVYAAVWLTSSRQDIWTHQRLIDAKIVLCLSCIITNARWVLAICAGPELTRNFSLIIQELTAAALANTFAGPCAAEAVAQGQVYGLERHLKRLLVSPNASFEGMTCKHASRALSNLIAPWAAVSHSVRMPSSALRHISHKSDELTGDMQTASSVVTNLCDAVDLTDASERNSAAWHTILTETVEWQGMKCLHPI